MIIMGLGNPGDAYAQTRHNVGFWCINKVARAHDIRLAKKHRLANYGEGTIGSERVVLVKPKTFVNRSGAAARYILERYRLGPESLLVVYDDMDLSVGRIRIRPQGSAAGHNGISSIVVDTGTQEFPRLRIGIGKPVDDGAIDHVLGRFSQAEATTMNKVIDVAVDAVECILREGVDSAMNTFNQRVTTADG